MTTRINQTSIIGPGSRLAKAIGIRAEGREYSFRPGESQLPERIEGTVLVFADPPSVDLTRACFIDLLSRIPLDSGAHIVLISSISAGNHASPVYPVEGPYAHRKRLAEDMVKSRTDLRHTIIRVGNVAEYGGWHHIFTRCHTALLPSRSRLAAVAELDRLRAQVAEACAAGASAGSKTLVSYVPTPVAKCFRRPLHVPGLFALYRGRPTRLLLKVAAKLLMRAGIYLPSPDDLNAFLVQVE